jgi:hypothetical protein
MIRPAGVASSSLGARQVKALQESPNWSGYAVASKRRGAFRSVSARWIMPKARCKGVAGHRLASLWVGLGGFSDHFVEQTGADADCRGRLPVYYGWYEMAPLPATLFPNKIAAGDHMSASVTFRGTRTHMLVLRDSTRHWTRTIIQNRAGIPRTSAEVIVEAPTELTSTGFVLAPLTDFGTVRFTGSAMNGIALRKLARVRILMIDSARRFKTITSLLGPADAFTCTYKRAN